MGTSTCDCMAHPIDEPLADVPGLCGIVKGSVLPGCWGLEAGQSAVGDLFNWVVKLTGPLARGPHRSEATSSKPGESGLLALDWNNGNRTVLVDPRLTGLMLGQTLHTTPAEMYRALVEATAFGALTIINRFEEYGVPVEEVVNCGGIAEKSAFVMQIYADVCGRTDEGLPLRPDLRPRLRHLRRGGRRRLRHRRGGAGEDDRREGPRLRADPGERRRSTSGSTPSTSNSTTPSAPRSGRARWRT